MQKTKALFVMTLTLFLNAAYAHTQQETGLGKIKAFFSKNGIDDIQVRKTAIDALYEVSTDKGTFFIDPEATYLFSGELKVGNELPDKRSASMLDDKYFSNEIYFDSSVSFTEADIRDINRLRMKFRPVSLMQPDPVIRPTPIDGIFEVLEGRKTMNPRYMSRDGRYELVGELFDLAGKVNLTEATRSRRRLQYFERNLNFTSYRKGLITYKPRGGSEHVIVVFTDPDCPFCRKFHGERAQYAAAGIEIRYVLVPFKGGRDTSYAALCSPDQNEALDRAFAGMRVVIDEQVESCMDHYGTVNPVSSTTSTPIDHYFSLARAIGVKGTPTILYENGNVENGYVPASQLIKKIHALTKE